MNAGSLLEVYTTLFGWSIYNTMFDLFRATGLILVPFIIMLVNNWKEPAQSNNDKAASSVSLARVSVSTIMMFLVFITAVLPVIGLDVNEMRYRTACTNQAGGTDVLTNVVGSSTGTTYDRNLGSISNVKVPMIWMAILSIGAGTNAAISSSFTCFEDIKALDQQLRNLTIKDQALRAEYFRFANECFMPAKSKFVEARRGGNYHDYVKLTANAFLNPGPTTGTAPAPNLFRRDRDDMFYIGSYYYQTTEGFYKEFDQRDCSAKPGGCGIKAERAVPGWPVNQVRDRYPQAMIDFPDPKNPLYGKPYCDEWWNDSRLGVRTKLLQSVEAAIVYVEDPAPVTSPGSFARYLVTQVRKGYQYVVYTDQEIEEIIIKRYIAVDPPSFNADKGGIFGTNDFAETRFSTISQNLEVVAGGAAILGIGALASRGQFKGVVSGVSAAAKSFASQLSNFYVGLFLAKQGAPMVQAILLMTVYMFLLIYLVMSNYELEAVIKMSFIILGFQFFTSIWSFADYLDAQLFVSMYPDATYIGGITALGPNRLILDVVLTIFYFALPGLLFWIMTVAGTNVGALAQSAGGLGKPGKSEGAGKGLGGGIGGVKSTFK